MAGRPRIPTETKRQRGTLQPCRTNPDAPKPQRGVPALPSWLDDEQRRHCRELIPSLPPGVLSVCDGESLATLGAARRRLELAEAGVREHGVLTEKGGRGGWATERDAAFTAYRLCLTEWGMTPASREKVSGAPAAGTDEVDETEELRREFRVVG